jgi:hypothetical protein
MTSQPWMTMHFSRTYIIVFSLFITSRTSKLIVEPHPTSVNDIFTPSDQTSPYRWYLLSGITYMALLNDAVAVMFTTQDLVERRCSEMTTTPSPHEDHQKHRRRRATVDQTNVTATGWDWLGVAPSSFPLPAGEPDGTFHQVRCLPCLIRAGSVLQVVWKCEINLQLWTVCRFRLQCTGTWSLRSSGALRNLGW